MPIEAVNVIAFLCFCFGFLSVFVMVVSGVYLGIYMKTLDSKRYKSIYVLYIPLSGALLFHYVGEHSKRSLYPKNKTWLFDVIRLSMISLLISFSLMFAVVILGRAITEV